MIVTASLVQPSVASSSASVPHISPDPHPETGVAAQVHVVEDDPVVQLALLGLVRKLTPNATAHGSAEDFLTAYDPTAPIALVLDVSLPGMSGIQLLQRLTRDRTMPPTVVLSADAELGRVVAAIRFGAIDFLQKPPDPRHFLEMVEALLNQAVPQAAARQRLLQWVRDYETLTPREREVFDLVSSGATTKQIALQLGLQLRTAHIHRTNVLRKFRADTPVELAHVARSLRDGV